MEKESNDCESSRYSQDINLRKCLNLSQSSWNRLICVCIVLSVSLIRFWRNFNIRLSLSSLMFVTFSQGFKLFSLKWISATLWSLSCSVWPWDELVGTSSGLPPVLRVDPPLTVTAEWWRVLKCWVFQHLVISTNWPLIPEQHGGAHSSVFLKKNPHSNI